MLRAGTSVYNAENTVTSSDGMKVFLVTVYKKALGPHVLASHRRFGGAGCVTTVLSLGVRALCENWKLLFSFPFLNPLGQNFSLKSSPGVFCFCYFFFF